jgi:hypothetical protein
MHSVSATLTPNSKVSYPDAPNLGCYHWTKRIGPERKKGEKTGPIKRKRAGGHGRSPLQDVPYSLRTALFDSDEAP